MSYPNPSNPDGVFLTAEGADEMDFARAAVNVITLDCIPPLLRQGSGGQKECVAGKRLSLVQNSWGKRLADVTEPSTGVLALIKMKERPLNDALIKKIIAAVNSLLGLNKCQFLRWADDNILVSFEDMAVYKSLGDLYTSGKLDNFNIMEMKGASFINAPQCFVEVLTSPGSGSEARSALNTVISTFSGAFTQTTVLESTDYPPTGQKFLSRLLEGEVPSLVVTLMFAVTGQSLATEARGVLVKSPWKRVSLPGPLQDEIGFDTEFFVHTEVPLPMIALKTGAPGPGVRITRLVQSKDNFDAVVELYETKLRVKPLGVGQSASGVLSKKFSLSQYSELVVSLLPGVKPVQTDAACLCFLGREMEELKDAEDNPVLVLSALR